MLGTATPMWAMRGAGSAMTVKPNGNRQQEGSALMSNIAAVTDATFAAEVEEHKGLALVDFWATWCGPCHMVAPIMDKMARDYDGRVKVIKVDVDEDRK